MIFTFLKTSAGLSAPSILRLRASHHLPSTVDEIITILLAHPNSNVTRQRLLQIIASKQQYVIVRGGELSDTFDTSLALP
jgi:hypothetical protein